MKSWEGDLSEREVAEAAADLDLDIAFGMVLKKLDELGIANNTYVIFTTDRGTPRQNPPFRGGKGTVSEGGLRVPFIIRGPGIKQAALLVLCSGMVLGATEEKPGRNKGGRKQPTQNSKCNDVPRIHSMSFSAGPRGIPSR